MIPIWQPTARFFTHAFGEKADAEKVVAELRKHDEINRYVRAMNIAINEEEAGCRVRVHAIKKKIAEQQDRCSHAETRYDADPAGGTDSTTECLICGRILP